MLIIRFMLIVGSLLITRFLQIHLFLAHLFTHLLITSRYELAYICVCLYSDPRATAFYRFHL